MPASSSMSRIFGFDFIGIFLHPRQDNAKGRPAPEFGLIMERTAMFFNNASSDRQAPPGPCLFGGKEGVEKTLLNVQGDAFAGVDYLQNDYGSRATRLRSGATKARQAPQGHHGARRTFRASRAERNGAVLSNTFRRVLDEVDQHLLDLLRVNPNPQ